MGEWSEDGFTRGRQVPDIYFLKAVEPRHFFFFLINCRVKEKGQIDASVFSQMVKTAKGIGLGLELDLNLGKPL